MARNPQFWKWCTRGRHLFLKRNKEYGDSIVTTGVLGAVVEITQKAARLRQLVMRSEDHGRSQLSKVKDELLDIHNYANIGLMMLEEDNWEGVDE